MFCATPKALRITEVQDIFWGVEEDLEETAQIEAHHSALGSGPRYMICVTLFCTLSESENTRTCENYTRFACDSLMSVCFSRAILACPCVF